MPLPKFLHPLPRIELPKISNLQKENSSANKEQSASAPEGTKLLNDEGDHEHTVA
jgi:hypothetical protein